MKIIVAHPAQQHSFKTAAALKHSGMLYKYATTVYNKPHSLTALTAKVLKGKLQSKANGRNCAELKDDEVIQFSEFNGLVKLFALHAFYDKPLYSKLKYWTADSFARKVANYAIKHNVDAVITYDDSSPLLFEKLKEKAPHIKRILDVSIATHSYMQKIFDEDTVIAPAFAKRLKNEMPFVWNSWNLDRTYREIEASDYFLVASRFVKKSLMFSGVYEDKILICPYGVDIEKFAPKTYDLTNIKKRPLKFVFVGGIKERKGAYYLLEAFRRIPREKAELTIVGSVNRDDADIQTYLNRVNITGMVLHSEVPEILRKSDVFVFPSLAEGMTLSALEAAACGLPLILTENTGANDCVTDGVEGFIIPIQSIDAIVEKVMWFVDHPEEIEKMGKAARKMSEKFTWDAYSELLPKLMKQIEK